MISRASALAVSMVAILAACSPKPTEKAPESPAAQAVTTQPGKPAADM